ncbi:hypothetical protein CBR_g36539 [Chara braunii]|uniref:Uncharacterized protein n=1 Tax=Chara braunii TaxID=69332 RepID=A0A388JZ24_CHABU|nr:hypothetical protein CBR_g36539 [Chara braunii]|eukprot:GBG63054.1 hypothetical protein CBR_g36539 [Chara braunii]
MVAGCIRWRVCKVRLWRYMGEFPMDDVEDDLRFDGTNLEDFVESLQLTAERGEWSEEEKRKQLIARSDKDEKGEARQDQIKKKKLQKKGLWIGREVTEPQGEEEENEEEDNVSLKKLKNKARVSPKSDSKESEQAEGGEQEEEEAAEERKRSMGASMVPRKKKLGKKRAIENGRRKVQERVSEKGKGVEEAEEGKEVQGGGKAPKVKRTEGKRPIGEKEETSGIGKKEDEKDGEMEKLMEDMEGMRKEVKKLKKEEGLQKEMSQLRVTLNVRSRENWKRKWSQEVRWK